MFSACANCIRLFSYSSYTVEDPGWFITPSEFIPFIAFDAIQNGVPQINE